MIKKGDNYMIKLIVTDIDDTLVNSRNEISKKNREVIEKLTR